MQVVGGLNPLAPTNFLSSARLHSDFPFPPTLELPLVGWLGIPVVCGWSSRVARQQIARWLISVKATKRDGGDNVRVHSTLGPFDNRIFKITYD